MFEHRITSLEDLRTLIPPPDAPAVNKDIDRLDGHCRAFIARSPFLVIASAGADGRCDASPKGGPPGFVRVLDDHRLAVPDYPGNRRLDSWSNVLATGYVQLIFFIPRVLETLRVAGRACLTRDPELLAGLSDRGKLPLLALGLDVEVAYLQCGKALKRSELWQPERWPERGDLPTAARIFVDHIQLPDVTEEAAIEHLARDYEKNLWPK
jgi:PPOX class probable FMN-dependent enzyme